MLLKCNYVQRITRDQRVFRTNFKTCINKSPNVKSPVALIKPVLPSSVLELAEVQASTVWGNCSIEHLERLLRMHKRCARIAAVKENSVVLFDK